MDDVLRRAPLFAALDDEQAAELRASMSEVTLARGDALFHEGDPGDRLYVVTEGKVKLHRTSPDGRENMLAVLGPGELIGELSLFDPGPRTATATALTEVKLLGLGHGDLQPWLNARPEVATALLRAVARRLRKTNDQMSDLVFSDVPGRVASALLDLSRRFGVQSEEGIHVVHDLTQEELAQLVGASRETVNKALADFAGRGWLRLEARAVILLDVERLAKRSPLTHVHGPAVSRRPSLRPGGRPVGVARTDRCRSLGRAAPARDGSDQAVLPQVLQLRPHRQLGRRPQGAVDVRVHVRDHLRGGAVAVLDRRLHLGEPVGAVREVELDRALGVLQDRAVARQDRVHAVVDRQRAQPAQRVEVVAEAAVGVGDHRRAAAQHRVARQHRPVGGEMEAERVGGVAGGRHDAQLQAAGRDHVARGQALVAEAQRRVEGAHLACRSARRSGAAPSAWSGWPWVSRVRRDALAGLLGGGDDRREVALVQRARVDDDGEVGVRARRRSRCWCRPGSSGRRWARGR